MPIKRKGVPGIPCLALCKLKTCHLILRGHQPPAPSPPHHHNHLTQQIHTWGTPSKPTQLASAMPHRVTQWANKCSRLTGSLTKWLVWGTGWISLGLQRGRVNFSSERLHYRTAWERGSPEYSSPALRLSCWKWDLEFPTSQAGYTPVGCYRKHGRRV